MLYFSYWRCDKKWPRIRVAQECVCTNRLETSSYRLIKKNNASKDILYVTAPDRLEYCTCNLAWVLYSPRLSYFTCLLVPNDCANAMWSAGDGYYISVLCSLAAWRSGQRSSLPNMFWICPVQMSASPAHARAAAMLETL